MSIDSSSYTTPSGMTGAGGGNMLRITGMATGLDVDAIVKKMMAAEQTKLDKAKQDQQKIQWKQDAYQSIIKEIKDLQSSFFDSAASDKNILSATNYSPFTATGDTSVATLIPGVGAKTGNYSIVVNQLASGAGVTNTVKTSAAATPPSATAALSTKLTDIDATLTGDINLSLTVGGLSSPVNITLKNTGTSTLGDLINAINNQGMGSVKATYSELTGEFKLNTAATGKSTSMTIETTGTTAALSSILGASAIGASNTGTNADITITPPGGTAVTLNDANNNAKSTNNFTIDGMSYNLSSLSPLSSDGVTRTATTVSVSMDTDKVYNKIKDFIDQYNTIVDEIQTKLTEKPESNYKPLTDAQKASMSESQITAWETKAKVGILRNDDNLQNLLNGLETAFSTAVSNTGLSIGSYGTNSFGIDTSIDYSKPAHVDIVDPSKLRNAIASNGDEVLKIFSNVSSATDGSTTYDSSKTQYKEDGIFTRINKILQSNVGFTNTTLNTAILTSYANKQYDYSITGGSGQNTLPDQLYEQQLLVKKITDEMGTKQEAYYQQFSQLETAMNQLNAQQSMLSSMISG